MAQQKWVRCGVAVMGCLIGLGAAGAHAAAAVGSGLSIGSANVAIADPPVPRPNTRPCAVNLLSDTVFNDFGTRPFSYAPPAGCKGPWSKVVLEGDFSVTAGRQFDRTASVWLGGVNLYFGTTEEPSASVAPSWHIERDLTDYAALFKSAQNGQAIIGNVVDGTYTGVIHGSARLLFYPAGLLAPAAATPDAVYPLGSDPVGNTVSLNTGTDTLSKSLSLPRNVQRAYLDVFAQSQGNDEFWYTCVPDAYASEVQSCGGGSFRETEISIDGQPAGVAPVYPWIYTGGIDPYLWRPTPGVQTLNFMPYRVDLTPFAGLLSDGAPHTVALGVAGANNSFSATATLLVYRDPRAKQVTGKLTRNTLAGQPATAQVDSTLSEDAQQNVSGALTTTAKRSFVIEGYADTSRGRVTTEVSQSVAFSNRQDFTIDASTYKQAIEQYTDTKRVSRTSIGGILSSSYEERLDYPLHLVYDQEVAADQSMAVTTTVRQDDMRVVEQSLLGHKLYAAMLVNRIDTADTLNYDPSDTLLGHNSQGNQNYFFGDTQGSCYYTDLSSTNGVLSAVGEAASCTGRYNRLRWFIHPDGSPDSRLWTPPF